MQCKGGGGGEDQKAHVDEKPCRQREGFVDETSCGRTEGPYLIFVTDATDAVCGEKLVMWRNSPHDMSSGKILQMINVGKLLHMRNVETNLSSGKFLHMRKVEKICHMVKFLHMRDVEKICQVEKIST